MDTLAVDRVRARIAKGRVAEMLARGWAVVGPAGEGMLLMEGPDPDLAPTLASPPSPLAAFVRPALSRARLHAHLSHQGRVFGEAA